MLRSNHSSFISSWQCQRDLFRVEDLQQGHLLYMLLDRPQDTLPHSFSTFSIASGARVISVLPNSSAMVDSIWTYAKFLPVSCQMPLPHAVKQTLWGLIEYPLPNDSSPYLQLVIRTVDATQSLL